MVLLQHIIDRSDQQKFKLKTKTKHISSTQSINKMLLMEPLKYCDCYYPPTAADVPRWSHFFLIRQNRKEIFLSRIRHLFAIAYFPVSSQLAGFRMLSGSPSRHFSDNRLFIEVQGRMQSYIVLVLSINNISRVTSSAANNNFQGVAQGVVLVDDRDSMRICRKVSLFQCQGETDDILVLFFSVAVVAQQDANSQLKVGSIALWVILLFLEGMIRWML